MVVHVVYRRRVNILRGGDGSVRFLGAAMSNTPGGKHHFLLAFSAAAAAAVAPASPTVRSSALSGGLALRGTSPPPSVISIASSTCWDSHKLRLDGAEDWEEIVAVGDETLWQEDTAAHASEGTAQEYGVVFEAPPTDDEVGAAIASIHEVFKNSSGVDSDALKLQTLALPISGLPSSGMFLNYCTEDSHESEKQIVRLANLGHSLSDIRFNSSVVTREHQNVLDAFHLLQEDPSVQKMVMALSTDKAVWNAVMNNGVVQEFKKSFQDAKEIDLSRNSSAPPGMMKWVLENTQTKIKVFLEKILKLVNTLFQAKGEDYDLSDDVVRMSFMLSVFIFIVVTMARIK